MKNLIILLVFALGGYYAYQNSLSGPSPVDTYKNFAKQWMKFDSAPALEFVGEGPLREDYEEKSPLNAGFLYKPEEIVVTGIQFKIEEENYSEDGNEFSLKANLLYFFDPPGAHTGVGAMFTEFAHEVKLKKYDSGWKLTDLNLEFIKTDETERFKKARKNSDQLIRIEEEVEKLEEGLYQSLNSELLKKYKIKIGKKRIELKVKLEKEYEVRLTAKLEELGNGIKSEMQSKYEEKYEAKKAELESSVEEKIESKEKEMEEKFKEEIDKKKRELKSELKEGLKNIIS